MSKKCYIDIPEERIVLERINDFLSVQFYSHVPDSTEWKLSKSIMLSSADAVYFGAAIFNISGNSKALAAKYRWPE